MVRFYNDSTANAVEQSGQTQLKECLTYVQLVASVVKVLSMLSYPHSSYMYFSFCTFNSVRLTGLTLWNYYPSRRRAIVGILIHYPIDPERDGCIQTGTLAVFRLTVKSSVGIITYQSTVQEFEKQLSDLTLGQEAEIKVEPPLELANGRNYCITIEVPKSIASPGSLLCVAGVLTGSLLFRT